MPRQTFPCDVFTQSDRQEKRQSEREIPCGDMEPLLEPVTPDLPIDFDGILADVDRVHPRAKSWVLAKLDGQTDVEIAKEWGTTPSYVNSWFYRYGLDVRRVFTKHLEIPEAPKVVDMSTTHSWLAYHRRSV